MLTVYVYIQIHLCMQCQLMKREAMNLKESEGRYMGGSGERKGKEEIVLNNVVSKRNKTRGDLYKAILQYSNGPI